MKPYAIEIKNVTFSYEGTEVLKGVNLSLEQGEFLGIIGPNGGGKTTLLKLMLGLLKPDQGEVLILGQPAHDARHRVGYVPQNVDFSRDFPISVMDVALMGRLSKSRIGKRYTEKDRQKVKETLRKVGMEEYQNRLIGVNIQGDEPLIRT
ncbi:MAG: ATP-binding cassette domain-containing protein, partial [Deltaproteobacteria bacterium]